MRGDRIEDCTTPPRRPSLRVNLLHAHGSPTNYLYAHGGCRCAVCVGAWNAHSRSYYAATLERSRENNSKRQRDYRAANLEKMQEKGCLAARLNRERHPDKKRESDRAYRESNPEKIRERARVYRETNPEIGRESHRRFMRAHPEKVAEENHRRRALLLGVGGLHTGADVGAQLTRQHGKCFWRKVSPECAVSLKGGYHIDHVVPLSGDRDSWNGPENIVISCPRCNAKKSNKDPMDFAGILF